MDMGGYRMLEMVMCGFRMVICGYSVLWMHGYVRL